MGEPARERVWIMCAALTGGGGRAIAGAIHRVSLRPTALIHSRDGRVDRSARALPRRRLRRSTGVGLIILPIGLIERRIRKLVLVHDDVPPLSVLIYESAVLDDAPQEAFSRVAFGVVGDDVHLTARGRRHAERLLDQPVDLVLVLRRADPSMA